MYLGILFHGAQVIDTSISYLKKSRHFDLTEMINFEWHKRDLWFAEKNVTLSHAQASHLEDIAKEFMTVTKIVVEELMLIIQHFARLVCAVSCYRRNDGKKLLEECFGDLGVFMDINRLKFIVIQERYERLHFTLRRDQGLIVGSTWKDIINSKLQRTIFDEDDVCKKYRDDVAELRKADEAATLRELQGEPPLQAPQPPTLKVSSEAASTATPSVSTVPEKRPKRAQRAATSAPVEMSVVAEASLLGKVQHNIEGCTADNPIQVAEDVMFVGSVASVKSLKRKLQKLDEVPEYIVLKTSDLSKLLVKGKKSKKSKSTEKA